MLFAEIFGYGVDNQSPEAWASREKRICPFRGNACTKSSKTDPIGICSISDGGDAAALCPVRFIQNDLIFKDAAGIAFGPDTEFGVFPEIRILKIENEDTKKSTRKIGKVDFVLGKIDGGQVVDFCAVEVQATYFSGSQVRDPMRYYLANKKLDRENSDRRPDFRSSAQKRLVPQLQLKVPVFRRWGKKFFIVTDTRFFEALPNFAPTTEANSELTWLTYSIQNRGVDYELTTSDVIYSEWDEVQNALREGTAPDPQEIYNELQSKLDLKNSSTKIIKI